MSRKDSRYKVEGCAVHITHINGDKISNDSIQWIEIDNIGKGGFCFSSEQLFEIEDRLQVILRLSDNSENKVLGRVCYCNQAPEEKTNNVKSVYGFSVISGFYELVA